MITARFSAAIRPAKPSPIGIRRLPNFLFQTAGRRRDQESAGGIAEEHSCGVDIQEVTHSVKQLLEQLVDVEMGEPGIGHRFDTAQAITVSGGRSVQRHKVAQ